MIETLYRGNLGVGGGMTWKAYGGGWDFCEHAHTQEAAIACAIASGMAGVVDMSTVLVENGAVRFTAENVRPYSSGGETVDVSAFMPEGEE